MLWAQLSIRWQMNRSQCDLFFSFSLFLYQWEEISKSLSLVIFVPQNQSRVPIGIQSFLFRKGPRSLSSQIRPLSLSLLFLYLNERVPWETFCVLLSLITILPAILLLWQLWPSIVFSYPWDGPPDF